MSTVLESSLATALLLGAAWLGAATALGPALGRYLKRNARRYPAPDAENAPKP